MGYDIAMFMHRIPTSGMKYERGEFPNSLISSTFKHEVLTGIESKHKHNSCMCNNFHLVMQSSHETCDQG